MQVRVSAVSLLEYGPPRAARAMHARVFCLGFFGGDLDRRHVSERRGAREPAADGPERAANPEHTYLEASNLERLVSRREY